MIDLHANSVRQIVLRPNGRWCEIVDPPVGLLSLLQTYRTYSNAHFAQSFHDQVGGRDEIVFERDVSRTEPGVVSAIRVAVPLYGASGSNKRSIVVDAGFVPIVMGWCARLGYSIRLANAPPPVLSTPSPAAAWQVKVANPVLLAAIQCRLGVLIRYDAAHVDPVELFSEIALAWRGRRVILVCTHRKDVRRAMLHLAAVMVKARAVYASGELLPQELSDGVDVWVTTLRGLKAPEVEARKADIVVLYNAREALGAVAIERVLPECRGRIVGLLPEGERLSAYERDCLWSILAAPQLSIPRPGFIVRRVRVVRVRNDSPVVPTTCCGLELLRDGVWHHHSRNRRLARLARVLLDNHRDLQRLYPDVLTALQGRTVRRVFVLVTVVDHAVALARLIRSAVVVCAAGIVVPGNLRVRHDVPDADECNGPVIVTPDSLGTAIIVDGDVLIRADSGVDLPPGLKPEQLYAYWPIPELLVVDVDDRHHPELRRATRKRERAYHAANWAVGADPRLDALRAFEATRPGGAS